MGMISRKSPINMPKEFLLLREIELLETFSNMGWFKETK